MSQSLTDINKHRNLTSICKLLYVPYATHDILIYLFLIKIRVTLV